MGRRLSSELPLSPPCCRRCRSRLSTPPIRRCPTGMAQGATLALCCGLLRITHWLLVHSLWREVLYFVCLYYGPVLHTGLLSPEHHLLLHAAFILVAAIAWSRQGPVVIWSAVGEPSRGGWGVCSAEHAGCRWPGGCRCRHVPLALHLFGVCMQGPSKEPES